MRRATPALGTLFRIKLPYQPGRPATGSRHNRPADQHRCRSAHKIAAILFPFRFHLIPNPHFPSLNCVHFPHWLLHSNFFSRETSTAPRPTMPASTLPRTQSLKNLFRFICFISFPQKYVRCPGSDRVHRFVRCRRPPHRAPLRHRRIGRARQQHSAVRHPGCGSLRGAGLSPP